MITVDQLKNGCKNSTEKHMWHDLKSHVAKGHNRVYYKSLGLHLTRIESTTTNGIPDVCFFTKKTIGFIELKICRRTLNSDMNMDTLTANQIIWNQQCPNSWVLVFVPRAKCYLAHDKVEALTGLLFELKQQYGHDTIGTALNTILNVNGSI